MQEEQRALIREFWGRLVQISEVRSLAQSLVANNIFTEIQISDIFSAQDERDNKERFFREFQEKDESAFYVLVDWLKLTGYTSLARKLAPARGFGITPFIEPLGDEEGEDLEEEEDEITSSIETEVPVTFIDTKVPLEIKVSLATEFRDSREHNPHLSYYYSRSKKRGRVLIINNYDFPGTDHKTRTGADVDHKNLEKLFDQMGGWDVKIKINQTAEQMKHTLKSFTKEKKEKRSDICFVFILSHGSEKLNETIVFGTDGNYLTTKCIHDYFTNEQCHLFRGKPKVFIYQVCRGHELDLPGVYTESDGKQHSELPSSKAEERKILNYFRPVDDMLIGYATIQGSKAHRDPFRGTWYIELICENFMKLARYESVDNLLVKVDEGLRKRRSELGTVQTSEHISRGFKKLYLNPGLYEDNGRVHSFDADRIM